MYVSLDKKIMITRNFNTYSVPIFNIKPKIDMKILVVVAMLYAVWLPGLPPIVFESNAGMVYDSMVISVHQNGGERH